MNRVAAAAEEERDRTNAAAAGPVPKSAMQRALPFRAEGSRSSGEGDIKRGGCAD